MFSDLTEPTQEEWQEKVNELMQDNVSLAQLIHDYRIALKVQAEEFTEMKSLCREAKFFIENCRPHISDETWGEIQTKTDSDIADWLKTYHNLKDLTLNEVMNS